MAFSPDGSQLAIQHATRLDVIDVATGTRAVSVTVGPTFQLAGPGAWTPDGRIAIWDSGDTFAGGCDWERAETTFRLAFVDQASGAALPGPALDEVTGRLPRLLGWPVTSERRRHRWTPASWTGWSGWSHGSCDCSE
ncbi:hypothetical protein K1W54_35720 [Micromonospora sp. CPCC 205371]|nr:hypothetical protein [Micromonospora sp. CPCC 205371]